MNSDQDMPKRRRLRLRLWHLFAIVTLAAVLVWLWPRLGVEVYRRPESGTTRAIIFWNGSRIVLWDRTPHEVEASIP